MLFHLIVLVLAGVYGLGVWKFWQGYGRTNFQGGLMNRLYLSFLWPALWLINVRYRENFQKALRGR